MAVVCHAILASLEFFGAEDLGLRGQDWLLKAGVVVALIRVSVVLIAVVLVAMVLVAMVLVAMVLVSAVLVLVMAGDVGRRTVGMLQS